MNGSGIQYDEEYDVLFVYDKAKRSSHGIEWGNINISYDKNGKLVNLELNNASKLLSNLTKKKITKTLLKKITTCFLDLNEKEGILYINFKFHFKNKKLKPIEDTLTVKALNYSSPVSG